MKARWLRFVFFVLPPIVVAAQVTDVSGVIQTVELNAGKPYFIPTHPRVTTTIRFPNEIGAPEGRGFTEDETKQPGEYVVSWGTGDSYFTVTPLEGARMANLNVPYQGATYVFYFYQASEQFKAVASVCLSDRKPEPKADPKDSRGAKPKLGETLPQEEVRRQSELPAEEYVEPTPARLLGLIDKLKVIHAQPVGPALAATAQAMKLEVAISREELNAGGKDPADSPIMEGLAGVIPSGVNDGGLYQLILLRAVRDRRMNCIGFVLLVRNASAQPIAFDVSSFGARAGALYLTQCLSDAPAIFAPGEQKEAYFVVRLPRAEPLRAANDWRISVDLVSPRLNPGAAIARGFVTQQAREGAR
jgi:hypothetical protein